MTTIIKGLEQFIDSDEALQILELSLTDSFVTAESLVKSFYEFDFDSPSSIITFLSILPVLDQAVLKQAVASLWPGYSPDPFDVKRVRMEVRGFLLDVLHEASQSQ